MAVSGTIKADRNTRRDLKITITAILQGTVTSPVFDGWGYPIGSFVTSGTFGSSTPSLQLQGSNDGGTTWVNVGSPLTSNGGGSLIGSNNEVFEKYQFAMSGGDGTTTINVVIYLSSTFG